MTARAFGLGLRFRKAGTRKFKGLLLARDRSRRARQYFWIEGAGFNHPAPGSERVFAVRFGFRERGARMRFRGSGLLKRAPRGMPFEATDRNDLPQVARGAGLIHGPWPWLSSPRVSSQCRGRNSVPRRPAAAGLKECRD